MLQAINADVTNTVKRHYVFRKIDLKSSCRQGTVKKRRVPLLPPTVRRQPKALANDSVTEWGSSGSALAGRNGPPRSTLHPSVGNEFDANDRFHQGSQCRNRPETCRSQPTCRLAPSPLLTALNLRPSKRVECSGGHRCCARPMAELPAKFKKCLDRSRR